MRIRWWPHTADPSVASTRLRCLRVMESLRARGWDVGLFAPGEAPPDVLVLAKRYDASSREEALRVARAGTTQLALDVCDNHFHTETNDPAWLQRAAALRATVAAVDVVVASSDALKQVIEAECPHRPAIHVIGDSVEPPNSGSQQRRPAHAIAELQLWQLQRRLRRNPVPRGRRIVWFGNQGSPNAEGGMLDLLRIKPQIEEAALVQPVSLTVISNGRQRFRSISRGWTVPIYYLPWSAATFSRAMACHDVAVIPIRDNAFARCKTSNRVATALLHGLSVVADPIPSYLELADYIHLGDWRDGLRLALAASAAERQRVLEGAHAVQARYSIANVSAHWCRVLCDLAAAKGAQ